jgi:diguanylate cyclase
MSSPLKPDNAAPRATALPMASNQNPTDLARETLKLLATRRIAPTPANYQRIYHEISGNSDASPAAERVLHALRDIAVAYPDSPPLTNLARAALAGEVEQFGSILTGLANGRGARQDWSPVIRELLRQIELRQSATSLARKKEGLERLLINFGSDPLLYDKLQSLLTNWGEQPEPGGPVEPVSTLAPAPVRSAAAPVATAEPTMAPMISSLGEIIRQVKELLAQTLEVGLAGRLQFAPELAIEARNLAQQAREARGPETWPKLAAQLKKFWYALELRAEDQNDMLESLLRLLGLMVNNISELVDEDQWVSGQLAMVTDVINQPLTLARIHEAERGFKEVIYKQSMLKHGLREAKSSFKRLIGVFVERLSEMSTSATGYHERIEGYAARLERADALNDLQNIVADLVSDTRSVQVDMMRHRDEIVEVRKQADQAENRVRQLEAELEHVSEQVREDQLTGTLNRRGLDDAMQREISRAQRKRTPLCVAILDLDNFKKLNDTYGHQAGDDALIHLANVVRKTLRPTDTVARFGGEEFVVVFAETDVKQAVEAMRRLQRELTKRFFLHDNERLLITFSAGVAALNANETQDAILARADKAMYQAKLQGKNRVVTAE